MFPLMIYACFIDLTVQLVAHEGKREKEERHQAVTK